MLNIQEILKISNDMGVEIIDNTEGKHYILDECGKKVKFDVDMLMNTDQENTSSQIQLVVSTNYNNAKFSSRDNLINYENSYVSKSMSINESIIDAA